MNGERMNINTNMKNMKTIVGFIAVMWGGFLLSLVTPINRLGIVPRSVEGIPGILLSPFLHGSFQHIISNTTAMLFFAPVFSLIQSRNLISKLLVLILLSGTITWLIAFSGTHIGASGLIFSLFGFLVSVAYFQREFKYITVSVIIASLYGYMIFGVLPIRSGVSWEGHLAGVIAGILYAGYAKKKNLL